MFVRKQVCNLLKWQFGGFGCAFGNILAGCALKVDVCIMAVSKCVVIVYGGIIWLSIQVEQCCE